MVPHTRVAFEEVRIKQVHCFVGERQHQQKPVMVLTNWKEMQSFDTVHPVSPFLFTAKLACRNRRINAKALLHPKLNDALQTMKTCNNKLNKLIDPSYTINARQV